MTKLIVILIVISTNCFAGFVPSCESGKGGFFRSKSKCEAMSSVQECYKSPKGFNCNYHKLIDEYINDIEKPVFQAKSSVVECLAIVDDPVTTEIDETKTQEEDCLEKASLQVCDSENGQYMVRAEDNSEVYCTKFLGYEQKLSGRKIITEDPVKKAAYIAKIEKRDRRSKRVAKSKKKMSCGSDVVALIVDRNNDKDLNQGQVVQLAKSYSDVISLLNTGSLDTAKAVITAMEPDGVIMTEEDKTEALELLAECM